MATKKIRVFAMIRTAFVTEIEVEEGTDVEAILKEGSLTPIWKESMEAGADFGAEGDAVYEVEDV
jgi:hypothetical protein